MRSSALLLVLLGALAGCGRGAAMWPPTTAAEVRLGEDPCAHCRMIVSDARFAAQARRREAPDDVLTFDDLGCLLKEAAGRTIEAQAVFVRPFDEDCWVRGDSAFVVQSKEIASPMGSGYAVFATRDSAAKEAARHAGAVVKELAGLLSGVATESR